MILGSVCFFLYSCRVNIWQTTHHSSEQNCLHSRNYFTLTLYLPSIIRSSHVSSLQLHVMRGILLASNDSTGCLHRNNRLRLDLWILSLRGPCCYIVKRNIWSRGQWRQPAHFTYRWIVSSYSYVSTRIYPWQPRRCEPSYSMTGILKSINVRIAIVTINERFDKLYSFHNIAKHFV